jgi:hypothetical protein
MKLSKLFQEAHVELPRTEDEFEAFTEKIIYGFGLPDTDDTEESIATLIMHMPQSAASAPLSYFANSVKKSMANAIAYSKLQEFSKRRKEKQEAKQVETAQESTKDEQSVSNT